MKKNHERAARWFHALGDETRLRIIDCLTTCERCVCELTDSLQTGQSRLSFHLKTLKDAGILKDRREGRWIYYSLDPDTMAELADMISSLHHTARLQGTAKRCE